MFRLQLYLEHPLMTAKKTHCSRNINAEAEIQGTLLSGWPSYKGNQMITSRLKPPHYHYHLPTRLYLIQHS